jgi:hypothetical protein
MVRECKARFAPTSSQARLGFAECDSTSRLQRCPCSEGRRLVALVTSTPIPSGLPNVLFSFTFGLLRSGRNGSGKRARNHPSLEPPAPSGTGGPFHHCCPPPDRKGFGRASASCSLIMSGARSSRCAPRFTVSGGNPAASTGGCCDCLRGGPVGKDAQQNRRAVCREGPAQKGTRAHNGQSVGRAVVTEPLRW